MAGFFFIGGVMPENVDKVGAVASTLCAIHCAVCAFLPAALGALGVGFLVGHEAEWIFTLVAIGFASIALILGWRQHRSATVAGLLVVGIVGLLASRAIEMGSGHHGHEDEAHASKSHQDGHADKKHGAKQTDVHATEADPKQGQTTDSHAKDGHEKKGEHPGTHDDKHADSHGDDHDDLGHLAGTLVGVLAGFILLIGHIFNIRASRQKAGDNCA